MSESPSQKRIYTQRSSILAHVGRRYHVVIRSQEFGNAEYDGTLDHIQTLDPNPIGRPGSLRVFDFLHFVDVADVHGGGRGARDFTIYSLEEITTSESEAADEQR